MAHLGGSASVEIDAPVEEVWAVVENVIAAPEWQGGLDKIVALERDADGRPTLADAESDIKVRRIKSRVHFRYEGPTRLSWGQEEGDMKSVEAIWELEDLGNGRTRVRFSGSAVSAMAWSVSMSVATVPPRSYVGLGERGTSSSSEPSGAIGDCVRRREWAIPAADLLFAFRSDGQARGA